MHCMTHSASLSAYAVAPPRSLRSTRVRLFPLGRERSENGTVANSVAVIRHSPVAEWITASIDHRHLQDYRHSPVRSAADVRLGRRLQWVGIRKPGREELRSVSDRPQRLRVAPGECCG